MKYTVKLSPTALARLVCISDAKTTADLMGNREITHAVTQFLKTKKGKILRKLANKHCRVLDAFIRAK